MKSIFTTKLTTFVLFFVFLSMPILHAATSEADMETKIKGITLPEVKMKEASVVEALNFFSEQSKLHDPESKGVNLVLRRSADKRVTLNLSDVSLYDALRLLCSVSDLSMKIEENAIVLTRLD
jgi:hypothetical protein